MGRVARLVHEFETITDAPQIVKSNALPDSPGRPQYGGRLRWSVLPFNLG